MILKIKKLCERTLVPSYAHDGDACFDIRVLINGNDFAPFRFVGGERCPIPDNNLRESAEGETNGVWLRPGDSVVFHTGLAVECEPGFVLKVYARSSTGIKKHLMLSNGTGIIDSGYRGELHISLTNFGDETVCVLDGDRVAQAEICRVESVEIVETSTLSDTERGIGGIGSTGNT